MSGVALLEIDRRDQHVPNPSNTHGGDPDDEILLDSGGQHQLFSFCQQIILLTSRGTQAQFRRAAETIHERFRLSVREETRDKV